MLLKIGVTSHTTGAGGFPVLGVARSGRALILEGEGFSAFGSSPIVSIASASGMAAEVRGELRNIRGQFVDGVLQIPFEWSTQGEARIFVTDGTLATQAIAISALPVSSPFITDASASVVSNQVQIVVNGEQFPPDAGLLVNGMPVAVTSRSGSSQVTANLAATQTEGAVQIINGAASSNTIPFRISLGKKVRIQYPTGYSLAYANLTVFSDSFQESVPSVIGQADVNVASACSHVMVSGIPVQDQGASVFSGFVAPLDYLPPINAETTAVAYAFIPLLVMGSVTTDEICGMRAQAAALPAVQSLKTVIESRLVLQKDLPNFTRTVNLAYLKAATNAVAALVEQTREAAGTASAKSSMRAKSVTGYAPEISPSSQYDVEAAANKVDGASDFNGEIEFINNTRVFYSAQATNSDTGIVITPHATGWMDPLLIQPQQGLVYLLGPYDGGGRPRPVDVDFFDADIELMKSISGQSSIDAAVYAATRTIFQQVMTPWLSALFGLPKYAAFDMISAVLVYYPALHSSFNAAIRNENYALAQHLLLQQLGDDFLSFGPVARYVARMVGRVPFVVASILVRRLVPFLNGALLTMDLGAAAIDTAVTLKDMATVPGRLEYTVHWPMWIESTGATTDASDAATLSSLLVIKGYGLRTKTPLGANANLRLIADFNGNSHTIAPSKVSPNGRSLAVHASEDFWGYVGSGVLPNMNDTLSITLRKDTDQLGHLDESNTKSFIFKVAKAQGLCPGTGVGAMWTVGWEYLWLPQDMKALAATTLTLNGCAVISVVDGW